MDREVSLNCLIGLEKTPLSVVSFVQKLGVPAHWHRGCNLVLEALLGATEELPPLLGTVQTDAIARTLTESCCNTYTLVIPHFEHSQNRMRTWMQVSP